VGNTRDDFLPFSRARIDALLPRIAHREKLIAKTEDHSQRAWAINFLVRAWYFKELELPPLTMSVRSVNPDSRLCGGVVEELLLGVQMYIPIGMDPEEIKIEDKFEVKIIELDHWGLGIYTELVRRIES
jgi:hypothetical protein